MDEKKYVSGHRIRNSESKNDCDQKVKLTDITMKVQMKKVDVIQRDCSCDSKYMLEAMNRVGKAICEKFNWIPMNQKCYCAMDNAGCHGTQEAIDKHVSYLQTRYNIEVVFQIPLLPYCNALDLGIWCCLQAAVERKHFMRRCEINALVKSVMETWQSDDLSNSVLNVFNRLKKC